VAGFVWQQLDLQITKNQQEKGRGTCTENNAGGVIAYDTLE
jgi:hypothetical protein